MNKKIIFLLLIFLCLASCTAQPATAPLPRSMKGYELYSWQADGQWHFTLLTGTNRLKTLEEITTGAGSASADGWVNIHVRGVDALKPVLSQLPSNEEIFWIGRQQYPASSIALPPPETIKTIQQHCQSLGVRLNVAE